MSEEPCDETTRLFHERMDDRDRRENEHRLRMTTEARRLGREVGRAAMTLADASKALEDLVHRNDEEIDLIAVRLVPPHEARAIAAEAFAAGIEEGRSGG